MLLLSNVSAFDSLSFHASMWLRPCVALKTKGNPIWPKHFLATEPPVTGTVGRRLWEPWYGWTIAWGVGGWLHLELKACFYFSDKQSRRARCSGQVLVPAPLLCMFSMTATLEHISCQSRDCTVFLCEPTCGSNRRESSPVRNTFHTHSFEFQPGPRRQRDSLQLYRHTDYIPD